MFYLIQENLYTHYNEGTLTTKLDRLGLEYEFIKLKPFIDDIYFESDRKDVMIFGAVKASHLAKKYDWNPGSFYNDNHDYVVYSKYYRENMLNWESKIQKISEPITIDGPFFARPTGDTKLFKGEIFETSKMWDFSVDYYLTNSVQKGTKPNGDTLIQVAPLKNIQQEIRCFIVKGKVVTASSYKIGGQITYKQCIDEDIIEYANEMASIYQISDAFVMDICRTNDGLKIVECNCLNCCGFYDIDIQKLIVSLEENFN